MLICVILGRDGRNELVQNGDALLAIIRRMCLENEAREKGARQREGCLLGACGELLP
jgi:hypothetical protein